MAFGDAILNLIGNKDPRLAILTAMQGGGASGAPQPAASTPAGAGTEAGGAAPAGAPPQPQAYTSPPELMELYTQLMDRQRKASLIDRGIGMIGASLAFPENRAGILQAFGGGGGSGGGGAGSDNPMAFITQMMEFQQSQQALAQKAAHRAALPAIAKQYGIDLQTAQYLFDTGKLDAVLSEALKPDNQIVTQSDGTSVIVDKRTGKISDPFGPPKPREIEIRTDDRGTQFAIYKDTGERVGEQNLVEGQGATENEQLWRADEADRKARGLPSRPLSQFIQETGRARAGAANLGATGVDYGNPDDGYVWKRTEDGSVEVNEDGAPVQIPKAGGKIEAEQKKLQAAQDEAEKKAAQQTARRETTSGFVDRSIGDSLKILERNKDSWLSDSGLYRSITQYMSGSDAFDLAESLGTIKANLGFDKLQSMRDESPTGAALGPVSDFENRLLQATFGSLEIGQSTPTLVRNLFRINAMTDAIINRGVVDQAAADAIFDEADRAAVEFLHGKRGENPAGGDNVQDLIEKYRSQ